MKKIFTLIAVYFIAVTAFAQSAASVPGEEKFGKVSLEDLQMQSCDFEKDANAEVLFKTTNLYYVTLVTMTEEVHVRIKLFNEKAFYLASEKFLYYALGQNISNFQAETINLVDGKAVATKIDKKQIYNTNLDKVLGEVSFAFPDVKPGCIIEWSYNVNINDLGIDQFVFQDKIPVRYAEFKTSIPDLFYFRAQPHFWQPLYKHTTGLSNTTMPMIPRDPGAHPYNLNDEDWVLTNVPSVHVDKYVSSLIDNEQRIGLDLVNFRPEPGFNYPISDTWSKVGGDLADYDDFGGQLNRSLSGEKDLIAKAAGFKNDDDKISFFFNYIKNNMKWNGNGGWYTIDGTSKAWDTKTGNATEINLILYHLLKKAGVEAYPMVVSTREHGKVDQYYTSLIQFDRSVVFVPVDSTKYYVLDASNKYNLYNTIPDNLLNSRGLYIDKAEKKFELFNITDNVPSRQVILINGEISPAGKVSGTVQIDASSYAKIDAAAAYQTDGEEKFIESLKHGDNTLKIKSLKFENMYVDTLPLIQNMEFTSDLAGTDQNYIYFKPSLFFPLHENPFIAEARLSDIDFAHLNSYSVSGIFKLPVGYSVDALPKNGVLIMPDKSIIFRRTAAVQDGSVTVRYVFDCRKEEFRPEEYPYIQSFFKTMFEMMDEQIVLKKS